MPPFGYWIYRSWLVSSKVRGELPDVEFEYVSFTSAIGVHYEFTNKREEAYWFDVEVYTLEEVQAIADLLEMQVKNIG